ncbi:MAG: DNA polymerase III subunit delta' [SAR202 cluster bacterium Io17-Chloro-G3]|nr:MAG: DNA polymerase III subunit delta' [SAR202 cluster bacterium Io17-Chloro-G3]
MSPWRSRGQDHLIQMLSRSLNQGRLAHAYLLVGPPHVGKGTLALSMAQAVNCLSDDERPCAQCQQCTRIEGMLHADIHMVTRTSTDSMERGNRGITIGQIREMEQTIALKPFEGRYRVCIIDGAEYLNQFAANALLKTLEEPPPQVLLLLLSSKEESLLATLRSRCQRLELRPMSEGAMTNLLVEEHTLLEDQAGLLARLSAGRLGWALRAIRDETILEERTSELEHLQEVVDGGLELQFKYAQQLTARFGKNFEAVLALLELWIKWWRDVLVLQEGSPEAVMNIDYRDVLEQMAHQFDSKEVIGLVRELIMTQKRLRENANPRLALEVLMLAIPRKVKTA